MSDQQTAIPARYGLIIPSSNRMAEPHAWAFTPQGTVPHITRLRMTGPHRIGTDALLPKVREAAAMLADAKCDPVIFHCTANSMAGGRDGAAAIAATIEAATGKPAATTASATTAALTALGAKKIVLVSPYSRTPHEHEIEFLQQAGIEILGERNLDLAGSDAYCAMPPADWLKVMADMKNDSADAYFVSCANIRATEVIPELEDLLQRPVITSNQVVIWRGLRLAGMASKVPALGQLGSL